MGIRDWFGGGNDYDRDYRGGYGRDFNNRGGSGYGRDYRSRGGSSYGGEFRPGSQHSSVLPHGHDRDEHHGSAMGPHWDERPYRHRQDAGAYPETRRGNAAGGRQGPGRAWGMGNNAEMESGDHGTSGQRSRAGIGDFGESRTPGMGTNRGSHFAWGMGGRTNMEGQLSDNRLPSWNMGAGPIATDSLRQGRLPEWHHDHHHGHRGHVDGDRYLRSRSHRSVWHPDDHHHAMGGSEATTSYGAEYDRIGRGYHPRGRGGDSMSARYGGEFRNGPTEGYTGGHSPGRPEFDETRGGTGYGRGYRAGRTGWQR